MSSTALGDGRPDTHFVPGFRAGARLPSCGRGGRCPRVPGWRGWSPATAMISAIFSIPGRAPSLFPVSFRCSWRMADAPAVARDHDHVAGRGRSSSVSRSLSSEKRPSSATIACDAGELGEAYFTPVRSFISCCACPNVVRARWCVAMGRMPRASNGTIGEDLPGIGRRQARLLPVAVGDLGDGERPETRPARPRSQPFSTPPAPDPRGAGRVAGPWLAGRASRRNVAWSSFLVQVTGLFPPSASPARRGRGSEPRPPPRPPARRTAPPGRPAPPPAPLPAGPRSRLADLPHRHRERHRHRASGCLPGMIFRHRPGNGPGTRETGDGTLSRPSPGDAAATG